MKGNSSLAGPHSTGEVEPPSPSCPLVTSDHDYDKKYVENSTYRRRDRLWIKQITRFCYILPIFKGIAFPMFKVVLIALAEKLLRAALKEGLDPLLYAQVGHEIFAKSSNPITDVFLLRPLDFFGAFTVGAILVGIVAVTMSLYKALRQNFLNYEEVKRLQDILCQKFILEPNSVSIDEASDLLYTKINAIEKYWSQSKYVKVDDVTTILTGTILFLVLAWDLGLAILGAMVLIFGVSYAVWDMLSVPWEQQRERKMAQTNNLLLDMVLCKELVLTQAQELQEQAKLRKLLDADRIDIQHLVWAKFVSMGIRSATFTMATPSLFLCIYTFDLTMDRVFQLLVIVVVVDEVMRAFLSYTDHTPAEAEFSRAKRHFCHVLGMKEEDLFPPDFDWGSCACWGGGNSQIIQDVAISNDPQYDNRDVEMAEGTPDKEANKLSFENASFGYKNEKEETIVVVKDLSTVLSMGEHYAIMGETGVGKTTFLKGLSGLQEPLGGKIYFDGDAVDTTSIQWRQQVAVVTQHAVFLNRSLRENLTYGVSREISDEEVLEALDKVKMKTRVLSHSDGLDAVITGNGIEFSGGERQRLQIARLLLTSCPLVLLDECTSSLDPDTTEEVLRILREFLEGKTMIMITHDVSTLVLAGHVLEMKPGGVLETRDSQ